ncbi:hypothetical protein CUZ56_01346 [Saezia sanguinis]|uniref:Uncharacterized protein n=1 Tax=Saezia sanguinis TaxID=1965230 RepID=A0A433SF79_9BURK|nr:hypothetical protein CUZ56_01346 [Saezia sanguinis]
MDIDGDDFVLYVVGVNRIKYVQLTQGTIS